jgi:hypothetical protein
MGASADTALRLLGVALILTGLVARLRNRALPTGVLAFAGFVVAEIPELLAASAR